MVIRMSGIDRTQSRWLRGGRSYGTVFAAAVIVTAVGGCGRGRDSPAIELAVLVSSNDTEREFTLTCQPDGGTVADPSSLCEAIAEHPDMLQPPPLTDTCIGPAGFTDAPAQVAVRGQANGEKVEFGARTCDKPPRRAEVVRLWLEAAGLA
jgi:hypothetical protein